MLKSYHKRGKQNPVLTATRFVYMPNHVEVHKEIAGKSEHPLRLQNSEILDDYVYGSSFDL